MRTARTDSPTKDRLLHAAQELMLAKGYNATTVDEICEAAGLTKGSFFHYFKGKEELGAAVLERFCDSTMQMMQTAPHRQIKDPLERLFGYVDFLIEMSRSPMAAKGCLLGTFAQELSDTHPKIRSMCAARFSKWAEGIKVDLDAAKAAYAAKARWDTGSLAEHFIAVMEGGMILAKAKQDQTVIEENLRHFRRYLSSLFGK